MKDTRESLNNVRRPMRKRPSPTVEPLQETGEFRNWYRNRYGHDPITSEPVNQESAVRNQGSDNSYERRA